MHFTGVTGVVNETTPLPDRDLLALQGHERTIAETLQSQGYYTVLVDKWHVGWRADLEQTPEEQGFDVALHIEEVCILLGHTPLLRLKGACNNSRKELILFYFIVL